MMDSLKKSHEKNMAHNGLALLYPVSVMGRHMRSNGIPHHVTVKFFDKPEITADDAHDYAQNENLKTPNPYDIMVTPKVFKNRFGEDVHVLALEGSGIDHVKQANANGSHLGQPVNYKFTPHISVDKETHDRVASMGRPVKASELGIKFGPPELRHGPRVVATYNKIEKNMFGIEIEDVELKKSLKHTAAATAALMGLMGNPNMAGSISEKPPVVAQPQANKGRMLSAIAAVESSSGKDTHHEPLHGMHQGESAYGKYGLTPITVRETVGRHPDLKRAHRGVLSLKGKDFQSYMQKNPKLEEEVASRHYDRLNKLFHGDPGKMGYAWLNGITGGLRAAKQGFDFDNHWHVKKIKNAYQTIENTKNSQKK
jgi:hypothetical protein